MTETDTRERPADPAAVTPTRKARGRRRLPVRRRPVRRTPLLLGVLAVLLAATLAWLLVQARADAVQRDGEGAALAVARQTVVNLLTIDPASAPAAVQRLQDAATGEFKQQLVAQGDQFGTVVNQAKVNATGTISEAGLRSATADRATVLVSAVGLVKNTDAPQGEPRQYRMVLDLARDAAGGNWLVAKLDFVP